ncbi:hypothetical protein HYH03_010318 [Edaphochlamys debaryana]|uniref:ShKT domain-containing protein n=1 Tax=Edaphochlamys debaryana TaxID=47281 RepID=A0A835XUB8_9CHLO|nr:hypothetical protein HYH03_010318 [Edaphochlamys debaryana]|eukprot:KAG2491312.1 hypothetical protein HYH03_010318 [Edaphochlamys debaryana]
MAKQRKASPGLALRAMAAVMLLFACGTAVRAQPETADSEPVPLPTTLPVLIAADPSAGADGAVTSTEPSVNGSRRLLAGEGARRRLASCTDQVNWCAGWKSSGYCGSQYVYNGQSVRDVVCAKTCGGAPCASSPAGGCTDQYSNCASWKSSGYCASQYTYNGKSVRDVVCAKTCGGAPCGSGGCSDKVSYCGGWKSSGYCAAGYTWNGQSVRDALCTKTCGTCGGPTPGNPPSGDSDMLTLHNKYRAKHRAPAMTWSSSLQRSAQAWGENLQSRCAWEHSGTSGVGENLYAHSSTEGTMTQAAEVWYNEIFLFDYNNGGFSGATGHATQMLWVASTQLGCAKVTSSRCQWKTIIVCHYSPAGE